MFLSTQLVLARTKKKIWKLFIKKNPSEELEQTTVLLLYTLGGFENNVHYKNNESYKTFLGRGRSNVGRHNQMYNSQPRYEIFFYRVFDRQRCRSVIKAYIVYDTLVLLFTTGNY